MGLNWGQALENAGAGLDRMSKQKTWEADIQYKELAAENRRRFAAEESGKQRDFLSSEAETKRAWEEPFKTKGLELQEQQIEISGDIRKSTLEQADYWKKITTEQTAQRIRLEEGRGAEAARANTATENRLTKEDLLAQYNTEMEGLKEKREAVNAKLDDKFFTSEEERAKLSQEKAELDTYEKDLGAQKDRGLDYIGLSASQQPLYDKASSNIDIKSGSDPAALHDISMKYAKLSEAKRAKLEETAKQLLESGEAQNEDEARAKAIYMLSGGKSLEADPPPTPPPIEPADKAPPEDTQAATTDTTVAGVSPLSGPGQYVKGRMSQGNEPSEVEKAKAIQLATAAGDMQRNRIAPAKKEYYMELAREQLAQEQKQPSEFISKGAQFAGAL